MKSKLDYDLQGFSLVEDHLLLQFQSEGECATVLKGGPLFLVGQLLAMEAWELGFMPGRKVINRAVAWLRLLALFMEFWVSIILAIAVEAGRC